VRDAGAPIQGVGAPLLAARNLGDDCVSIPDT
jgi:hypothetical protein